MKLSSIVERFTNKKILVIGDIMLDEYIFGNVESLSPEAPLPILEFSRKIESPGGAANVANNIRALKGIPILVGVIGDDENGDDLIKILKKKKINTEAIFIDKSRPTTTKTRIVDENFARQLIRIDREKKHSICKELKNKIINFINSTAEQVDAILFEDYDKGVLDKELITKIIDKYKNKLIITADPKFEHFFDYKNVHLFKPNKRELESSLNIKINKKNLKQVCEKLKNKLNTAAILLTLGKNGSFLLEKKEYFIPAKKVEVFDKTGAGDIIIASATMALTAGASFYEAATIANITASIEITKFGATPVNYEELSKNL